MYKLLQSNSLIIRIKIEIKHTYVSRTYTDILMVTSGEGENEMGWE